MLVNRREGEGGGTQLREYRVYLIDLALHRSPLQGREEEGGRDTREIIAGQTFARNGVEIVVEIYPKFSD